MSFVSFLCASVLCLIPLSSSSPPPQASPVERGESQSGDLADPTTLSYVLDRLARVAELYEGQAFGFVALEEIRDRQRSKMPPPYRVERTFKYEFIYGTVDEEDVERAGDILPGVYMDYRRRAGSEGEELAPDEIVEKHRLAAQISRGFSFPVGFRRSVQSLHRYEILRSGMRFPSRITQERRMVNLRGLRSGRERSESEVFLVTQTYSDYRFFNIRTEAEIHDLIFGGTARARIKKE